MKQSRSELNGLARRTTRRSLQWCLLPLVIAMAWVGCKKEATVADENNPVGTYRLVSVDRNRLPCAVQHEGRAMTVNSGGFVINADGTCSSKMLLAGSDSPIEVKATYTREGSKLTMQWQGAGTTTGTFEANTLTMNNEGKVFTYRK